MRYHLEIRPNVRKYLSQLPLMTREGRIQLAVGLRALSDVSDPFRADPDNRLGPGSSYLRLQYAFPDAGRIHMLTTIRPRPMAFS